MLHRPLTPLTLTASLVATAVVLWALPQLLSVLFTVGLAVLFGLVLDAPVSVLARRGVPRGAATWLVLLAVAAVLVGGGLAIGPSVAAQLRELTDGRGDLVTVLIERLNELGRNLPVDVPEVDGSSLRELLTRTSGVWGGALRGVGVGVANALIALFLAVWGVTSPQALGSRLLRFVPPQHRERTSQVARKVELRLRRWAVGQLTLMTAVGLGSYVVFKALGVPFAELFAVAAMLFEAVPAIGVALAAAGPAVMLLIEDPSKLVWLLLGILIVQQLEDRLVLPRVMGRAVELPEAFVLLGVLSFGVLFGVGGMVLATPLLAALVTVHDELTAGRELAAGADQAEAGHVAAVGTADEPAAG